MPTPGRVRIKKRGGGGTGNGTCRVGEDLFSYSSRGCKACCPVLPQTLCMTTCAVAGIVCYPPFFEYSEEAAIAVAAVSNVK